MNQPLALTPTVLIRSYDHCSRCGSAHIVLWQADCRCWTSKCTLCGDVGWGACACEMEGHWEAYEDEAERIT